jgi:uncharacterized membrane protein YfcA
VLAAPFGGWLVKKIPAQKLMTAVGLLIVTVSIFQLLRAFRADAISIVNGLSVVEKQILAV